MPKRLRQYVRSRISHGAFGNVSEYFRDLVRHERNALANSEIEARLLRSLNEGDERPMPRATWTTMRNAVRKGLKAKA